MNELQPLVTVLLVSVCALSVHSVAINNERCAANTFYCPEDCTVTYIGGCPHRCDCGTYAKCPEVRCPAPEPICSIHTLLDGCQTCACKLPYAVVEKGEPPEENFLFLDGQNFNQQLKQHRRSRKVNVLKKYACTIPNMQKVDQCMHDMMTFNTFLKSKRRSADSSIPLNPMLRPKMDELDKMCGHMRYSLKCMGPKVFEECRRAHPHLAEMDAVYGYPCGPKQDVYMHHMQCIQKQNQNNYRMLACEDSMARSLSYIANSTAPEEIKRQRKCDAMNWLMKCEKPAVSRLCSNEAAEVYNEAMETVTEYMAPECVMNHERHVFEPRDDANDGAVDLLPKEHLACNRENQDELKRTMGKLYDELVKIRDRASLAYPLGFWIRERRLPGLCRDYKAALAATTSRTKNKCYKRNEIYDTVHYALHFPCGYASRGFFKRFYPCLTKVRRTTPMRECEFLAHQRLEDPSNDVCESYSILADCMYDHVVGACGYDAMEVEYQYMNMVAQKHFPGCQVKRIFRFIDTKDD